MICIVNEINFCKLIAKSFPQDHVIFQMTKYHDLPQETNYQGILRTDLPVAPAHCLCVILLVSAPVSNNTAGAAPCLASLRTLLPATPRCRY